MSRERSRAVVRPDHDGRVSSGKQRGGVPRVRVPGNQRDAVVLGVRHHLQGLALCDDPRSRVIPRPVGRGLHRRVLRLPVLCPGVLRSEGALPVRLGPAPPRPGCRGDACECEGGNKPDPREHREHAGPRRGALCRRQRVGHRGIRPVLVRPHFGELLPRVYLPARDGPVSRPEAVEQRGEEALVRQAQGRAVPASASDLRALLPHERGREVVAPGIFRRGRLPLSAAANLRVREQDEPRGDDILQSATWRAAAPRRERGHGDGQRGGRLPWRVRDWKPRVCHGVGHRVDCAQEHLLRALGRREDGRRGVETLAPGALPHGRVRRCIPATRICPCRRGRVCCRGALLPPEQVDRTVGCREGQSLKRHTDAARSPLME